MGKGRQGEKQQAGRRPAVVLLATASLLALLSGPSALARPGDEAGDLPGPPAAAADAPLPGSSTSTAIIEQRLRTEAELRRISGEIGVSRETLSRLDASVAALVGDRDRLRAEMIATAARQKAASTEVAAAEARIRSLGDREGALKGSLRERRGVLAEVLAALERMGRKPPPALLVKPGDALGSVRSAILLGAVVPEIRSETEALLADLQSLAAVRSETDAEKGRFADALGQAREEETRLARLVEEKTRLEAESRGRIGEETRRAAELAATATSLEGLIAELDAAARRAQAREAEERTAAAREAAERQAGERRAGERQAAATSGTPPGDAAPDAAAPSAEPPAYDVAALRREMASLEPAAPFSTMKGSLVPPVAGRVRLRFGEAEGRGREASGVTFQARAADVVTAPADGQVLYAGPFRSYGQLLILNAGDGYHIVLAGMDRIDAAVGQFVLSGEPLAVMGSTRVASASGGQTSDGGPSLYVEFRKDGNPVDPAPWWADGSSGRTRNDT